jgi:hypothetical protein
LVNLCPAGDRPAHGLAAGDRPGGGERVNTPALAHHHRAACDGKEGEQNKPMLALEFRPHDLTLPARSLARFTETV